MPDDHSEVEPPLPIPNRTVKRLCADDSEHSLVKVGHCQANLSRHRPLEQTPKGFLLLGAASLWWCFEARTTQAQCRMRSRLSAFQVNTVNHNSRLPFGVLVDQHAGTLASLWEKRLPVGRGL